MNHPVGSCYNYVQETADFFHDLQEYNTSKCQPQCSNSFEPPHSSDDGYKAVGPTNQGPFNDEPPLADSLHTMDVDNGPFIEEHEGAAQVYGWGVTFMLEFM